MELVQRRDAATLLPIITAHTAPGTIIHSDEWAAYRRVQGLPTVAAHGVVNHSLHFVEPTTGVHTQPAVSRLRPPDSTPPDSTLPQMENGVSGRITELFAQLSNDLNNLGEEDRASLKALLISYADIFALDSSELGTTQLVTHSINTGQHLPIKQQVRRTPFALRKKVDELVEEMLDQDVVEPSESPWASPIVLVQKKDGGVRFCVDYRKLNQITKLDEFPLPRIDDTLDLLAGSCHFTALDLASGYWQVAMDPESKEKTAFTTYAGLYQFKKMPFGLVNAPATFQRLMTVVLSALARRVCVVYLDDVLVFGRNIAEHNANLTQVLERLRRAGLRLKPKKCRFALKEVEYLGHVVSAKESDSGGTVSHTT